MFRAFRVVCDNLCNGRAFLKLNRKVVRLRNSTFKTNCNTAKFNTNGISHAKELIILSEIDELVETDIRVFCVTLNHFFCIKKFHKIFLEFDSENRSHCFSTNFLTNLKSDFE